MHSFFYVTGMTFLSALNQWSAAMIDVAQAEALARAVEGNPALGSKRASQKSPIGFKVDGNETIH